MSPSPLPLAFLALLAATLGGPAGARADTLRRQRVDAELTAEGWLHGTTTLHVVSDTSTVRLWIYADRLAAAPAAMDEHNAQWIYPREVDLSEPQVEVRVDGGRVGARWERRPPPEGRDTRGGDLLVDVGSPGAHVLSIRFRYRLPERFGRIGRIGRRLTLTGPWYPLLVDHDGSTRLSAVHDVTLRSPAGYEAFAPGADREHHGDDGVHVRRRGTFVPFVLAPQLHTRERPLPRGFRLRVRSHRPLYRPPPPTAQGVEAIGDLAQIDVVGNITRVAREVVGTLQQAGVPVRPCTFEVVLVPSRTELAATAPGVVVVSDRLYEVFPLAAIEAFHDRALRRALFRAALQERIDTLEPPLDRDWSEDLRAVVLSDLDELRRSGQVRSARDLIAWAGFHPAIDQLLYAPQVAFVDAYFGTIDEPDPFRDAPGRSRRPVARGRRLFESARDVLTERELRAWSRALLSLDAPARAALAEADPEAAGRLDGWLDAPATQVNYRLGRVVSEPIAGGYRHRVTIHRDGDARREPVEVRIEDEEGNVVVARWDGPGPLGVLLVETPAPLDDVQIDPRGRLVQSAELADGHPRRDDGLSLPWRPPLLQGFNAAGSSEGVFIGLLDFALRRRYDLENTLSLRLSTGPRATGGVLRYTRGVGRKRDTNNRVGFVSAGFGIDRLHGQFTTDGVGGWRSSLLLAGGYNTQRYFLDPRRGSIAVGTVRGALTRRDDGRTTYTLSPSLRANLTVPEGLRAATVFVGGAAWVFGDALPSELPGLGGRFYLRGYRTDEAVGRGRVFLVVEQRFTPTALSDLSWDLVHLAWVRQIQLALFAGGGLVFQERSGREWVGGLELGAGVRVHFEYGGIQPGVLALDLAAPLVRRPIDRRTRPPVTFTLAFQQYL